MSNTASNTTKNMLDKISWHHMPGKKLSGLNKDYHQALCTAYYSFRAHSSLTRMARQIDGGSSGDYSTEMLETAIANLIHLVLHQSTIAFGKVLHVLCKAIRCQLNSTLSKHLNTIHYSALRIFLNGESNDMDAVVKNSDYIPAVQASLDMIRDYTKSKDTYLNPIDLVSSFDYLRAKFYTMLYECGDEKVVRVVVMDTTNNKAVDSTWPLIDARLNSLVRMLNKDYPKF